MGIIRITKLSQFPFPKMSLPYLFSLLLLSSASLQAQSLLWKITGNGLKEPAWIYGTMHVRDSRVFKLPEGWDDKLRDSKRLILELNPTDRPDPMKMMALMAAPEDSTLERTLKPEDRKLMEEGCLSVRPLYGKVRRATRATIEAYDAEGNKFTLSGSGLIAHIFQHEIDHLEGILFIDKAIDIHESNLEKENE